MSIYVKCIDCYSIKSESEAKRMNWEIFDDDKVISIKQGKCKKCNRKVKQTGLESFGE